MTQFQSRWHWGLLIHPDELQYIIVTSPPKVRCFVEISSQENMVFLEDTDYVLNPIHLDRCQLTYTYGSQTVQFCQIYSMHFDSGHRTCANLFPTSSKYSGPSYARVTSAAICCLPLTSGTRKTSDNMKRDIDLYFKQNPFPMFQRIPTFTSGYFKSFPRIFPLFGFKKPQVTRTAPTFATPVLPLYVPPLLPKPKLLKKQRPKRSLAWRVAVLVARSARMHGESHGWVVARAEDAIWFGHILAANMKKTS